jgi:transaldolase
MPLLSGLKVKLFADGAELSVIARLAEDPLIRGFTTNPTLMRKAGVLDYEAFAREVLTIVPDRPVSFEVFSDDFDEMERQALEIAAWGENVHVKIPVTNTRGACSGPLVRRLSAAGVKLNVTAILTAEQVARVVDSLAEGATGFVSVFAGRIADTGRDPIPVMMRSLDRLRARPGFELIWASPRELLNVFQADAIGCHVLTATKDILSKLSLVGKDLDEYSLETVQMFYDDAQGAGYTIEVGEIAAASGRSS